MNSDGVLLPHTGLPIKRVLQQFPFQSESNEARNAFPSAGQRQAFAPRTVKLTSREGKEVKLFLALFFCK